jgi:hypothetical protein
VLGEEAFVVEPAPEFDVAAGTRTTANVSNTPTLGITSPIVSAISDVQFNALATRVGTLENRVDALTFRLDDLDASTRGGIAAAMAMGGTMVVPDSKVSVSLNAATYRGEQGFSGAITLQMSEKVYISGAVTGSTTEDSTAGRVGVAFGF